MAEIIDISKFQTYTAEINVNKLRPDLISPAKEFVECDVAPNHTSEPIKKMEDIDRITNYLIEHNRWRDNMLFIVGINFGLRVGDLLQLRFCNLINDNMTFKDTFPVFEQKTRNTRKRKKNRYITVNFAVKEAVVLYLEHVKNVSLSDYMFRSESNNGKFYNEPMSRTTVHTMLKGIAKDLNLNIQISSHTLRKTFAYHQMVMSDNDPRKLMLLSKMLNHSSVYQTLDYIGITAEEIHDAYLALNLGSSRNYLAGSQLVEMEEESA